MKANELKKGMVLQVGEQNIMVKHVQVQAPSSRSGNTLYKVRGQDVSSGQKFERSFKGEEVIHPVDIARRGKGGRLVIKFRNETELDHLFSVLLDHGGAG